MAETKEESITSSSDKAFNELYNLDKELGAGAFSVVNLGSHKISNEQYAIKVITKEKMEKFDEDCLKEEINVLNELKHDKIIQLHDVFDEEQHYYLVTELVCGGMLFDRLVEKEQYTEADARDVCKILLDVLSYIHDKKIAHRDLKPENLLLLSDKDDSSIKVADFGFAKKCTGPKSLKTQCGSPGHVAPEILENVPYDTQVDMWSLGVIIYTLIGGYPPFYGNDRRELFTKIRKADYQFDEEWWGPISQDCKDMIASLLVVDMDKRATAHDILTKDKWMVEDADETLRRSSLACNQDRLKKFCATRKLKAAIHSVIAYNKLTSLGEDLKTILE